MLSSVSAAVTLLALTGCESTPKDERSEGRAIDDKHITQNVQKDLEREPTYKFNGVDVSTFAGVVQLSGFVNTEGQRARAQEIAQDVNGVREVKNGIALKPLMPTSRRNSDQQIYAEPQKPTEQSDGTNQVTEPK
jgi:osmotically-inducible protein OsmY